MIRNAKLNDLQNILEIYNDARAFMIETGNPTQWNDTYPSYELLSNDIQKEHLFVITQSDEICGVFAFIIGDDSTYKEIKGKWLSNKIYGTIHRIASKNGTKGIFSECLKYCESNKEIASLRIDTHNNNCVMKHLIEKSGFTYCGIINEPDCTERVAFEKLI